MKTFELTISDCIQCNLSKFNTIYGNIQCILLSELLDETDFTEGEHFIKYKKCPFNESDKIILKEKDS